VTSSILDQCDTVTCKRGAQTGRARVDSRRAAHATPQFYDPMKHIASAVTAARQAAMKELPSARDSPRV